MGMIKGGFLRLFGTTLRFLEFCCAGFIVGVYSYFLATLCHNNYNIPAWVEAIVGISGLAVIYTIGGFLFTCCLGGTRFFAILAMILDVLFAGAFVAVAYYTRWGANDCSGYIYSPIGNGYYYEYGYSLYNYDSNGLNLGKICRLDTACFAFAIIACVLFPITSLIQMTIMKNSQQDNTFGGQSSRFGRNRDAEMAPPAAGYVAPPPPPPQQSRTYNPFRRSHDSAMTGSTMQGNQQKEYQRGTY